MNAKLYPLQTKLLLLLPIILIAGGGCRYNDPLEGQNLVVLVPGCAGDGFWYNDLRKSVAAAQPAVTVRTFEWGMPKVLYVMNLQDAKIHDEAEAALAKAIASWRDRYPAGRLTLLGHSAGCGVILGSLSRLEKRVDVENVVLLAPSVSPDYEISPALGQIAGTLHVFFSDSDRLWLGWRTSTFGTYDSVKGEAAGKVGLNVEQLKADLRCKIVQHSYEREFSELGHGGGHFGSLARRFDERVVAPIVSGGSGGAGLEAPRKRGG
jgi:pimeloyl-ACP methyl ester carboxylesterase